MNITLIRTRYSQQLNNIVFNLKTDYGNVDFILTEKLELDWNWMDYSPMKRPEKEQIEIFIKQYLFDKLREVV